MVMEPIELYKQATEWTKTKVRGAADKLDTKTPCEEWDVRHLISHMIDTQQFFTKSAKGQDASLPQPMPPDMVGDDPVGAYDNAIAEGLAAFEAPGGAEKAGFGIGVAFSDSLIHGWDLATATGQDAAMPDGLAQQAYDLIHGKFTDEQRKGLFKDEVAVPEDASPQEKLLAYTGRRS